jgi:putative PIN family toxin of toxin-antitoxin system
VLDTNILLDLFIFQDPATQALRAALATGELCLLSTAAMREELRRVLDYPQLQPRMRFHGITSDQVLSAFDELARLREVPPKAPFTCKDADDQKFIDLAVTHRAQLCSKDKAVLCMTKRLSTLGVAVSRNWAPAPGRA